MEENKVGMDDEEMDMGSNFQQTFGWFIVINKLSQNDFTKHEYIFERTLNEVLNQLSYLVSYEKEQERLMRKARGEII